MNSSITEIKNTLERTNSRLLETEDGICELEDRLVEITAEEQNKAKKKKKKKAARERE